MNRLLPVLWALGLFATSLWLNTRWNSFPWHYHPDEPGKVEQVVEGRWNFNHPMLLLSTASVATRLTDARNEQSVVENGRWVSASFTAAAVVALSFVALLWRGWIAAIATGLALALHHQLFELAHYMKEDTALLLGVSLTFLAMFLHARSGSLATAIVLGVASGLAVAGKYLGVIALPLAVSVLLWRSGAASRGRQLAGFAVAALATFALVNLPLLADGATFQASLGREVGLVVKGQSGMTRSVPHAQYWNVFIDNTTPAIWLLLLAFLAGCWRERSNLPPEQKLTIAFPFLYALVLSFSPKSNDRYFLPATALFTMFAALGVKDGARFLSRWLTPKWATAALVLFLVGGQLPSWWRYARAFQHDDTAELITWLRDSGVVPATATIASDRRVGLPDPTKKKHAARVGVVPQSVLVERYAADLGTLAELRQRGVEYVAVSESDYGKFFLESLRPQEQEQENFARRKDFYEELLAEPPPVKLLFRRDRGTVIYLHPGIRVYRISSAAPGPGPAP